MGSRRQRGAVGVSLSGQERRCDSALQALVIGGDGGVYMTFGACSGNYCLLTGGSL